MKPRNSIESQGASLFAGLFVGIDLLPQLRRDFLTVESDGVEDLLLG